MIEIFQEFSLGKMWLKNRFVMSAADDNLTDIFKRVQRFSQIAQGGVGLIISGGTKVHEIDHWSPIMKAVHENGGKIALQIVAPFGGRFGFMTHEDYEAVSILPKESVFFQSFVRYVPHEEFSEKRISELIDTYVLASKKAKAIGSDAIEIHSAHHSLLMQFLSPITNKRKDRWGGSLENRSRIHQEILSAIKKEVGKDFPLLIKLGVEDCLPGGLTFQEGKTIAKILAPYVDGMEISQGLQDFTDWNKTPMRMLTEEAYFLPYSKEIKKEISIPIILSGGLRSFEVIEKILQNREADLIGLCRPLIRESDLIFRWKNGDRKKATCISCNQCIVELLLKGLPLECYLDKKER
jgi:2,4-dienoyl-CoA reductase-like NADH-dependent reductase (Old Yellow Enzyme family)